MLLNLCTRDGSKLNYERRVEDVKGKLRNSPSTSSFTSSSSSTFPPPPPPSFSPPSSFTPCPTPASPSRVPSPISVPLKLGVSKALSSSSFSASHTPSSSVPLEDQEEGLNEGGEVQRTERRKRKRKMAPVRRRVLDLGGIEGRRGRERETKLDEARRGGRGG